MGNVAAKFGISPAELPKKSEMIVDDRRLGIEIEQEYENSNRAVTSIVTHPTVRKLWRTERDGSLRNTGFEFVSTILWPHQVEEALDVVLPAVALGTCSWRAGIHVHVDVADLDELQLRCMAKLYAMLEHAIFAWEGTNRDQSRFCVPWYTCTAGVRDMFAAISSDSGTISRAFSTFGKYTALNMIPICNQGTVEFRHMQTVADKQSILKYVNLCLGIVQAGKDKVDVLKMFSTLGVRDFIREIFGDYGTFLLSVPNLEELLWRGMDTANSVALSELNLTKPTTNDSQVPDVKDLFQLIKNFNSKEGDVK